MYAVLVIVQLQAMAIAAKAARPVVIADTQDNPGAGGNGDTTGNGVDQFGAEWYAMTPDGSNAEGSASAGSARPAPHLI